MDEDPLEKKRRATRERMRRYRERLRQDSKEKFHEENQNEQHLQPQSSTINQSAYSRSYVRERVRETTPERVERLAADARSHARRRAQETPLEREMRLAANARNQRQRRSLLTQLRRAQKTTSEHEARLAADAQSHARRRAQETALERELRIAANARSFARRKAKETPLEREMRLAANAKNQRQRRRLLTQEQIHHQYALNRERRALKLQSQSQAIRNEAISLNESTMKLSNIDRFTRIGNLKRHATEKQRWYNKPYIKGSSSAKQFKLHAGTQPHDLKMGSVVISNLCDQLITSSSTDVTDKAKERFSKNKYFESSGIADALPKITDEECLYISSTVDRKESLSKSFGCGICDELLEIETEFLQHCSIHRFCPPVDLVADLC